jgi:uncharacterized membrane protein
MEFLARLHPLVVHLPIGILLLAFLLEVLSRFRGYKKLRSAVFISILLGTISAIFACISGWLLSQDGGYDEPLIDQHKFSGLATAAVSIVITALYYRIKLFPKVNRNAIRLFSFLPLVVLILITGHLGGSVTHGEDFLFSTSEQKVDAPIKATLPADLNQAVVYGDLVKPLLESKCYGCHSSKKQKGKLRLDSEEWILKGGKDGLIITQGKPNESELFRRIALPIEDEDHMPPREKIQLTSGEMDLVSQWISDGASFNMKVAEAAGADSYLKIISASSSPESQSWWPKESVSAADESAIQFLKKNEAAVENLSEGNNYLSVSFIAMDTFPSNVWPQLSKLKDQIVSLRLTGNFLSPMDWKNLSEMRNLRMLYLDKTSITDQDLSTLNPLDKLYYLNLTSTKISDNGLNELASFQSLQKLFVFGTSCTPDGTAQIKNKLPECEIDAGGYALQKLTTDTLIYRKSK